MEGTHESSSREYSSSSSSMLSFLPREREFIDNLLVRTLCIIVMIWWTGLAPWEPRQTTRPHFNTRRFAQKCFRGTNDEVDGIHIWRDSPPHLQNCFLHSTLYTQNTLRSVAAWLGAHPQTTTRQGGGPSSPSPPLAPLSSSSVSL